MSGYVRIHRQVADHPAFRNRAEVYVFVDMVLRAAWKPVTVRYRGQAVNLCRGQLAVSVRDLAEAFDRDKGWVERVLKRLRDHRMIETVRGTASLLITICNYDKYQAANDDSETGGETVKKTAARQRQDTEQEREEVKEDTPPTPRAGGRRVAKHLLPADWIAPPVADLPPKARACAEQWTRASYDTHAEAFVSYWRGEGKMKSDWRGTWANRVIALHSQVMRDQRFGNAPTEERQPSKPVGDTGKYLAAIAEKPWMRGRENELPLPRVNGPPRSIGQLAAGIAGRG